jgi:LPXTG-site transpeptidase (sortase) family protein
MASDSDMLNIGSLRLRKDSEYPMAQVQGAPRAGDKPTDPVIHPEAAAAARARIDATADSLPVFDPTSVPATPTADLITDRQVLAKRPDQLPSVANRKLPSAVLPVLTAVGIFAVALLLFKAPVVFSQLGYALGGKPTTTEQPVAGTTGSNVIPAANTITIPKINVHAPVIYEPSVIEADVQRALENGVVHYGNTAVPGQAGNSVIFGHSSNDWWEPGNYKFVFVLLDKLAPGDRFTVDYQSKRYTYEITGSKVVEPTDIGVLNQTTEPTFTLITCTPPGTSLRRLVVTAKQVDPSPAQVVTKATPTPGATTESSNLPSAQSGFFDQVKKAWDGIVHGFKSLFGSDESTSKSPSTNQTNLPVVK